MYIIVLTNIKQQRNYYMCGSFSKLARTTATELISEAIHQFDTISFQLAWLIKSQIQMATARTQFIQRWLWPLLSFTAFLCILHCLFLFFRFASMEISGSQFQWTGSHLQFTSLVAHQDRDLCPESWTVSLQLLPGHSLPPGQYKVRLFSGS